MHQAPLSILLIHPAWRGLGNRKKIKVSETQVHPLALGVVAAIMHRHDSRHQIRIVNQATEPIPWDAPCDLVGITANTYTFPIACEIAARFRARGVVVIMGGVHPTLAPEECLPHADAVVAGEAEEVLPILLDDSLAGRLQPLYRAATLTQTDLIPAPERGLFASGRGDVVFAQATRGCANACRFCYLGAVSWGAFRMRPVGRVLEELAGLREQIVLFVDDNMFVDRDYALELFRGMRKLGKHWWAQAPTTLAGDGELLKAAADAGCFSLSYGFQTVCRASLAGDRITHNRIEDYVAVVRETQRRGILVDGTFIFGFDGDDASVFEETVGMILRMGLDTYTFYFLTAYPGTPHYEALRGEGRLLSEDRGRMDWDHPAVRPLRMSAEELERGVAWAYATLDRHYRRRYLLSVIRNARFLMRSPALARFLISAGRPTRHAVEY